MLRLLDFHGLRDKSKSRSPFPSFTSKARGQGVAAVGVQGKGNREGHDKGKGIDEQSRHHDTTTDIPNMGKSNKFDCTNRRNEGVDLGKSIGDAARKELEKTKKDAVRQAGRARKASAGSLTGGENDIAGVHLIDLVAPSKALTDDGVAAMVEGLHAAMKAGTSDASVTLEGLNLRDNQLTTKALATLAPVIHLAQNELKTIVLSDNNITVTSDAEAKEWEIFLTAFRSCKTLRRLDLSGNCELGSRALEIFCKVHCNEPHIDPIALGGDRSVYTLDETQESDDNKSLTAYDDESGFDPMTLGTMLRRRCGLRSIPYISLQNVGINDTGALWLSYVLEDHYFPNQLVNEINAAPATSSVDAFRQGAVEGGIDWSGHKGTLGKDGFLLLTKTEAARKQTTNTDALSSTAGSSMTTSIKSLQPRRHSRASLGDRRLSIRSIHTDDGGEHELSEVESIRKHIQRHIIDNRGVNSVGLWNAALQVIAASRKLAYIAPPDSRRSCFIEPRLSISPHVEDVSPKSKEQRLDSVFDAGAHVPTTVEGLPSADEAPSSPTATMTRNTIKSYVATLAEMTSPDRAETAITEVTNTPGTPKRMFVAHRKGAFSEGSDLHTLSERLSSVQMEDAAARDRDPERFIKWQEENAAPQSYRHTHLACHLPQSPFERILTFALATPGDMADWGLGKEAEVVSAQDGEQVHWPSRDLLSDKQLRAAYDWGQDRDSLVQERKWAGMAESTQRFMLLDAIGCLAYEA